VLKENFRGASPHKMGAQGFAWSFLVRDKKETHESVYEASNSTVHVEIPSRRTPCTSIAKTVQKIFRRKK